ncbi:MAG: protein-disulfide reductase DsbD domain-containing protein, partial [Bacillota bacterium]
MFLAFLALCALLLAPFSRASDDFLEPEKAFQFSAKMVDAATVEVRYKIADGYYMYRERFAFKAEGARLGEPVVPPGKVKFDQTFQKNVETYHNGVTIRVPVEADGDFILKVTGQGCADQGLCYAPMESQAKLSPQGGLLATSAGDTGFAGMQTGDADMGRIEATLKSGRLMAILPLFLLLGLGLSFTPCVLPMVPILSSIIVGEGVQVSRARGFALSAAYSLGMALIYTALGVAAGLVGEGLAATLQNPWMLGAFATLM